jgi:uncharacterized protein (DUF1330 family)
VAEPKGYWIVRVDISDEEAYDRYRALNGEAFAAYGARFLVRGGPFEAVEGAARARNVVIEFPTVQAARDCYFSDAYTRARAEREGAGEADILIIEGC